jgi:adenylate cyclase
MSYIRVVRKFQFSEQIPLKTAAKVPAAAKIRFPIGAKLVVIISAISLVSLGAITVLSSWLMTEDIRVTIENNNFTVNKRSAVEAEETLTGLRSDVNTLLNTLAAVPGSLVLLRRTPEHRDCGGLRRRRNGPPERGVFHIQRS